MGNMGGRSPAPLIRTGFKAEIVQDGDMTGTERTEPAKLPTSNNRSGTAPESDSAYSQSELPHELETRAVSGGVDFVTGNELRSVLAATSAAPEQVEKADPSR